MAEGLTDEKRSKTLLRKIKKKAKIKDKTKQNCCGSPRAQRRVQRRVFPVAAGGLLLSSGAPGPPGYTRPHIWDRFGKIPKLKHLLFGIRTELVSRLSYQDSYLDGKQAETGTVVRTHRTSA